MRWTGGCMTNDSIIFTAWWWFLHLASTAEQRRRRHVTSSCSGGMLSWFLAAFDFLGRRAVIMTYDFRVSLCVTTQLVLLRSKLLPQPPISALTTTLSTLVDTAHSVVHRKMPMDLFCSASHSSNQCIKMAPSIASTTSFLLPLIALSTPGFM